MKFWKIVKTFNETDYNDALKDLEKSDEAAAQGFKSYNPRHFCRAFLSKNPKSDTITSNLAENYNGYIINDRTKHLIYMLEDIRAHLMQRLVLKRHEMEKSSSNIYPRIKVKLEKEKEKAPTVMCCHLMSIICFKLITFWIVLQLIWKLGHAHVECGTCVGIHIVMQ